MIRFVIMLAVLSGCAHEATLTQTFPDGTRVSCIASELNTSIRNSSVVASCIPQKGSLGIDPIVSVGIGTSMTSAAIAAAAIVPKPMMIPAPQPTPERKEQHK